MNIGLLHPVCLQGEEIISSACVTAEAVGLSVKPDTSHVTAGSLSGSAGSDEGLCILSFVVVQFIHALYIQSACCNRMFANYMFY